MFCERRECTGVARWVLTPPEPSEAEPSEAQTPGPGEAADSSNEAMGVASAVPQVRGRWSCEAAPDNIPRLLRPVGDALLDVVEGVKASEISLATSLQPVADEHAQQFPG